ncbi:MAG: hypothetical protein ACYTFI_15095 [Planctomycetota bacterium]|jgi:hypothetical protein
MDVYVVGVEYKHTGREPQSAAVFVYRTRDAMREAIEDFLPEEAADHIVDIVEGQRGRRETFDADYVAEAAPDYHIADDHMEEFYEHIEAVWLERVPLEGCVDRPGAG